jgi:hypothetical protein
MMTGLVVPAAVAAILLLIYSVYASIVAPYARRGSVAFWAAAVAMTVSVLAWRS